MGLACACVKGGGGGSCCGLEEWWGGGGKVGALMDWLVLVCMNTCILFLFLFYIYIYTPSVL